MCSQRYAKVRAFLCSWPYIYRKIRHFCAREETFFKKNKQKEQKFLWKNKKEFVSLPQIKNI
jgi:hypothetical protein